MLGMHGVGTAKMAKYGHEFLTVIQKYVEDNPTCLEERKDDIPITIKPTKVTSAKSSETIMATIAMVKTGQGLEEVAVQRGLKSSTVASHVEAYLAEGNSLNIDHCLDPHLQVRIKDSFEKHGMEFLKPVVNEIGMGYDPVKIMRGMLAGQEK
jgi:ATP-dependent DNA helicase RecQ